MTILVSETNELKDIEHAFCYHLFKVIVSETNELKDHTRFAIPSFNITVSETNELKGI